MKKINHEKGYCENDWPAKSNFFVKENKNQKRQLQVKVCTHLWTNVQENKY